MPYHDGKLDTILQAIVSRLIANVKLSSVAIFNAASCYISLDVDDTPASSSGSQQGFICVVAPADGNFEEANIDGGGEHQATDISMVRVKVHSPVQLDEYRQDTIFLTDSTLGILEVWRQIVAALMTPWFPLDASGNVITRDPLIPGRHTITRRNRALGAIEQDFKLTFDMDVLS